MDMHGGDSIARVLKASGVRFAFTLCGGHIAPILTGCKQLGIRIIDVRDEANAVFAADAVARLTGTPGVAIVTAGPGVTNTITAVTNARLATSPLVILGGAAATVLKGRGALQDIDHGALLRPVTKAALTLKRNCDIIPMLEAALRITQSGVPGPVFVECPIDLLYPEALVRQWYAADAQMGRPQGAWESLRQLYLSRHVDRMFACDMPSASAKPAPGEIPRLKPADLRRAVQQVRSASQPVLVIGTQATLLTADIGRLAAAVETLGIPTYLTGMARGLLGRAHALQLFHHRKTALRQADLIVLAGMPCDFRMGYGRGFNPAAKIIAINRSRQELKLNCRPDVAVCSDPLQFCCALADEIERPPAQWAQWLQALKARDAERDDEIALRAEMSTAGINPLHLFCRLEAALTPTSTLIVDGGDFAATAAYLLRPRGPLQWLDPGVFGTLGVGAGFALGAKLCRPEDDIWIIYGDGAAGYSLQEFDTFVRHNLPVIGLVGNDASWAQIARDQVKYLKDDIGTVLRHTDYHRVAQGYGGEGIVLEHPDQIDAVLVQAQETARGGTPVLINALIGKSDFREGSISV
jgi:acetolactate synthase-1/2/3 large subunit